MVSLARVGSRHDGIIGKLRSRLQFLELETLVSPVEPRSMDTRLTDLFFELTNIVNRLLITLLK